MIVIDGGDPSAADWWMSVLQGSVGAIIALLGLFGAYWLTARHERLRAAEEASREASRAARNRTAERAAAIVQGAAKLAGHYAGEPRALMVDLVDALILFSFTEAADHPNAARWAHLQKGELIRHSEQGADPRALRWQAGYVNGWMTGWAQRGFPDLGPVDVRKWPGPDDSGSGISPEAAGQAVGEQQ